VLPYFRRSENQVGQGMSLTRLDERVQRIEKHLLLGPAAD